MGSEKWNKVKKKFSSFPSLCKDWSPPKPIQDLTAHKQVHFDGKIMKPRSKVEQREQLLPVKAGEENRN